MNCNLLEKTIKNGPEKKKQNNSKYSFHTIRQWTFVFLDVSGPLQINTEVNFLTNITNDSKERQSTVKKKKKKQYKAYKQTTNC